MRSVIDAARRIRVSFQENGTGRESWLLFDSQGTLVKSEGEALKRPELMEALAARAKACPKISGKEQWEIQWEGEVLSLSVCRYIHMTLGEFFNIRADLSPEREALVDCGQGRRLTYGELKEESDALALSLIRLGVQRGDKIAVIMDNCWENVVTKEAIEKTGGVIVNLNIHEKDEMLARLMGETDVKAVFIRQGIKARGHLEMLYGMCPELKKQKPDTVCCRKFPCLKLIVVTKPDPSAGCAYRFWQLLEAGRSMDREILKRRIEEISPFDDATIIHTSGTTGKPKGVVLCHAQLIESAWSHVEKMELTCEDRFYMSSPMFHSLGCIGSVMSSIAAGNTLVFAGGKGCEGLLDTLREERCTVLSGVPTVYFRLLEQAERQPEGAGKLMLRLCVSAGAPCPSTVYRGLMEKLGVKRILTMYGMTEAGPGISSSMAETPDQTAALAGCEPWPGVELKIRDLETGRDLPAGEAGEVCVRSFGVMKEYYNNPEETRQAVDGRGWLFTGDVGYLSEEGKLFLLGRCKDLIIHGGENISPNEVEEFLRRHEAVEDAAVVGVPDPQYGENVFAFVRRKPGHKISQEDLIQWCRGKIATIKIPQMIEFVDDFPVGASGKTDKRELEKRARALCGTAEKA